MPGKSKKSVDNARRKICEYVRNIIPGIQISKIAHDMNVNTGAVIVLSNYCNTEKELVNVLKRSYYLNEITTQELQYIIENNFDEEGGFDISKASILGMKIENMIKQKREEIKENERLKGTLLTRDHKRVIRQIISQLGFTSESEFLKSQIGDILPVGILLEYLVGNNIIIINATTRHDFLIWYAEKEGYATHPDALMQFEMLITR